jgi:hypothetical protein
MCTAERCADDWRTRFASRPNELSQLQIREFQVVEVAEKGTDITRELRIE